jgi:hypothetical protein
MSEVAAQIRPPEKFLKSIEVSVSDDENTAKLQRLAVVDTKIKDTEAEKAGDVSKHNESLKQLRKEQRKLLEAIQTKKELRDIECYEKRDERLHKVTIHRADNDMQVDERPMTAQELGGEPTPAKPNKPAKPPKAKKQADLPGTAKGETTGAGGETERAEDETIERESAAAKGSGVGKVTRIKASDAKKKSGERKGGKAK